MKINHRSSLLCLGLAAASTVWCFAQQGGSAGSESGGDSLSFQELRAVDEVSLRVSNVFQESSGTFSDAVVFFPNGPAGSASWELSIQDYSEHIVQRFAGTGACPKRIAWFGVGADGVEVRDGFYRARLTVGREGQPPASREESFSFMTPPDISPLTRLHLALREDDAKIVVRLPDLLFDVGSAGLSPRAPDVLDAVARFLKAHPQRPVFVLGHTDNTGNAKGNLALSDRRARSVYTFLLGRGVAPQRIRYRGMGSDSPIADNRTPAGRSQNRRVEVWLSKTRSVAS